MTIVQIVANPKAGSYDPATVAGLERAFIWARVGVIRSEAGPGLPLKIAEEADILCTLGGDGSIRHTALAIRQTGRDVALAAWPGGTINLFQRELDKPADYDGFARATLAGTAAALHWPVVLNDTLFLGCASIGPDAAAVAGVSEPLKAKIGRLAYGASMAKLVWRWPRPALVLEAAGQSIACEALYIAMGRFYAGPWSFAPHASRTEPDLHIVALKRARRRDYLSFMIALLRGTIARPHPNRVLLRVDACTVAGPGDCPVQIDGDDGPSLPLNLRVGEAPIRIC